MYIFDPASPHPVAVQSSVSRRSDVVSAVFDKESVLCSNKNGKSFKMSKLYFLNQEQVWENCRKFIWFLSVLRKKLTVFDWVSDAVRFCARNHDVFTKFVKLANTWAIYMLKLSNASYRTQRYLFPFQKLFTLDFGESEDKKSPVKSQVSNCDPVTLRNDQFVISPCNVIINIITVKLCYWS